LPLTSHKLTPGPGNYTAKSSFEVKVRTTNKGFGSDKRTSAFEVKSFGPGPGTHNPNIEAVKSRNSINFKSST